MLTVKIETTTGQRRISGAIFGERSPRIVYIDGYSMDTSPQGHMVFFANDDRPGMLGLVGTLLGNNKVNIASVSMGRDKTGGTALACFNVDGSVPAKVLDELGHSKGILWAKQVTLECPSSRATACRRTRGSRAPTKTTAASGISPTPPARPRSRTPAAATSSAPTSASSPASSSRSASKVFGCSSTVASMAALAELAEGQPLSSVRSITPASVESALGGLHTLRRHAADLSVEALFAALDDHTRKAREAH